jgi:cyclic-di-GMP-binding protein
MKMGQLTDVLINRAHKQGIAPEAFDMSKESYPSGKVVKKEVSVKNGLKQEDAKKIVKLIKDAGLKVQAAIMDDMVRVTGKKIDDLQEVIQLCRGANLGLALQYENMRS